MSLVGGISGSAGVATIVGALHLSGGADGAVTTPYIAIENGPASGSLGAVGGVTDKLHNRNGVLYFGSVNLQSGGGVTQANQGNNRIITSVDEDNINAEANLQFDGTDLFVAGAGKVELRSAADNSSYINSPMSGGMLLSASNGLAMHAVVSGSKNIYTVGGLFTSGHVLATGSVTGKSGVVSNGTISGSTTLQIVGASTFVGNVATSGNLDAGGDLTAATITCTGFAVDADGDTALKSLTVDDGSTIGPDSVTDLLTLTSDGDITFKNGTHDFDIASHDGTNGLALGGTIVTATAANLNLNQGLTAGTVAASKTVTVDSNKDVGDFRNVTATGLLTVASITASMGIMPDDDNTQDLGSSAKRWRNIYTGDLHLANDRGNWTVIEEPDFLSLRNNKTGQRFKLEMTLLDPGDGNYGPGNDGKL